jgi:hypothetical protein
VGRGTLLRVLWRGRPGSTSGRCAIEPTLRKRFGRQRVLSCRCLVLSGVRMALAFLAILAVINLAVFVVWDVLLVSRPSLWLEIWGGGAKSLCRLLRVCFRSSIRVRTECLHNHPLGLAFLKLR